jgi:hypothetical protein
MERSDDMGEGFEQAILDAEDRGYQRGMRDMRALILVAIEDSHDATIVRLNENERAVLFRSVKGNGGFQQLLVNFRKRVDVKTGILALSEEHRERIARYAFDYGNGGWEDRLVAIFGRSLGPKLGRP